MTNFANLLHASGCVRSIHNDDLTWKCFLHHVMASQITGVSIIMSTVCSGADQRRHQSFASLPLWWESTGHRWIPSQRASNAENVSNLWRQHGEHLLLQCIRGNSLIYWHWNTQFTFTRIYWKCKPIQLIVFSIVFEKADYPTLSADPSLWLANYHGGGHVTDIMSSFLVILSLWLNWWWAIFSNTMIRQSFSMLIRWLRPDYYDSVMLRTFETFKRRIYWLQFMPDKLSTICLRSGYA